MNNRLDNVKNAYNDTLVSSFFNENKDTLLDIFNTAVYLADNKLFNNGELEFDNLCTWAKNSNYFTYKISDNFKIRYYADKDKFILKDSKYFTIEKFDDVVKCDFLNDFNDYVNRFDNYIDNKLIEKNKSVSQIKSDLDIKGKILDTLEKTKSIER